MSASNRASNCIRIPTFAVNPPVANTMVFAESDRSFPVTVCRTVTRQRSENLSNPATVDANCSCIPRTLA